MERTCPACGTINEGESELCRICGHRLDELVEQPKTCAACGHSNAHDASNCTACGRSFTTLIKDVAEISDSRPEECEHWSEQPAHAARTAKVGVAGVLILLAGFLGITHALLSILPGTAQDFLNVYEGAIPPGEFLDGLMQDYDFVAGLLLVCGVLAVAMSMFSFNRTRFDGALAGAVFGIVSIGFLIGAFFALLALILIATSRREFISECA